jgi:putative Mg2+ transporter-C (MgtC) family protein
MASALMMIISKHAFDDMLMTTDLQGVGLDVSRVAAGIIAGMGIFSGGIVFVGKRGNVSGLTTAAGIWATIGIGMVIGAGMYVLGIGCVVFVELIQVILHRDLAVYKHASFVSATFVLNDDPDEDYQRLKDKLNTYNAKMNSIKWEKKEDGKSYISCYIEFKSGSDRDELIKIMNKIEEVVEFEIV